MDYNTIKAELSQGSERAYEQLFRELYRPLCRYAFRMIPDTEDAEDTVQAVFVGLWDKRSDAGRIEYLKSYLYQCVYHACLKKLEHEKVRSRYYTAAEYELTMMQFETFEASTEDERMADVNAAIDLLPEKNREVFRLRFIDGLNTREVSEQLQITPRTVETHVSKALRFLRDHLSAVVIIFSFFPVLSTCINSLTALISRLWT